jgi:hypothetical protein
MIYNEEHRRDARAKIVTVARGILAGELGIVAGARQLAPLHFDVAVKDDPDVIFFVGVDSESDHLPVGEVRRHWNAEALRAKDADLEIFEARVRVGALEACRSLIRKYERLN